ncbi:MAG: hypothetical protein QQN55_07930, partial [Nitrosopumilus sp.]
MKDDSSPDISEDEDLAIENDESDSSSQSQQKPSRFEQSGGLDFNFVAYDQDICILGSKGSGKSFLANSIMKSLNGISVWVYDFNFQFHSSRAMVFHDMNELLKVYDSAKRGHYILQPYDNSENTFR